MHVHSLNLQLNDDLIINSYLYVIWESDYGSSIFTQTPIRRIKSRVLKIKSIFGYYK